jgi:hypothetical protein
MKSFIKLVTVSSLLIVACALIAACGGGTEQFVQGNGQIDVTVKNAAGTPLTNILIEVREDSLSGKIVDSVKTDTTKNTYTFQKTVGTNYYFTFTDTVTPARYATQNYNGNPVQPALTGSPKPVDVVMAP